MIISANIRQAKIAQAAVNQPTSKTDNGIKKSKIGDPKPQMSPLTPSDIEKSVAKILACWF